MAKRYQYSNKVGDKIIVVETIDETWTEFVLEVEQAETQFNLKPANGVIKTIQPTPPQPTTQQTYTSPPIQSTTQNRQGQSYLCQTCGGSAEFKQGVSKAGKPYKLMRCVAFPELVRNKKGVVGHSFFLDT